jgi:uncharacterized repeat protein (TIGR01451 family)
MRSFNSLTRLQVLALICCGMVASEGGRRLLDVRAAAANEPPLLMGPALELPAPPPLPLPPPLPPDGPSKGPPAPVVKVTMRVPACSAPGAPIEYRICVENCSPAEAHHVTLRNAVPANAQFVRAEPPPSLVGPELQWHLGTIGGGAVREICLVLQPTNRDDVKNCTRVQFEHGQCVTTRQAGYPPAMPAVPAVPAVPATPPSITPAPVMPPATDKGKPPMMPPATDKPLAPPPKLTTEEAPKLELSVEGHPRQYVNLGSHYFVTVTNTGKARAANVRVTCRLPAMTQLVRASADGSTSDGQVTWALGELEAGARRTVELVLRAQAEGTYCVIAEAQADPNAIARADACTEFIGVSALHLDVSDRIDPVAVGTTTSYVIVVRNQGSAAATNLKLRALVPPALQFVDAKGPTAFRLGEKTDGGQWVEMDVLPRLDAMASQTYEIVAAVQRAGPTRMRVELSADQLTSGPVVDEEGTTVFAD